MSADLFNLTFDQQVDAVGDGVRNLDIAPNRRISAEVVFEPIQSGVRVTARDMNHRMLWGFIGSQGMLDQVHCPVAVYDALESLLTEELAKHRMPTAAVDNDALAIAHKALVEMEQTVAALRKSIDVKKISPATLERAGKIAQAVKDANRQIVLETSQHATKKDAPLLPEED